MEGGGWGRSWGLHIRCPPSITWPGVGWRGSRRGVWLPQAPYIPFLPGSEIDAIQRRGSGRELRQRGVPAGGPGSPKGCARRAPAPTYLLQQRDGVPAVVQPRSEAGRGGRVVVLGGLGDELGDGDLVRHPAGGGGETQARAGGESRRRLPGPRAGRRLMNDPRAQPATRRPAWRGCDPGGSGRKALAGEKGGGGGPDQRSARGPSNSERRARLGALGDPPPSAHARPRGRRPGGALRGGPGRGRPGPGKSRLAGAACSHALTGGSADTD